MKYIASKVALFIAALFVTVGVWAQDHQVKATVPFAFTVNSTVFAPGTYAIKYDSSSPQVLHIDGWETGSQSRVIALPNPSGSGHTNVLVFHRYGNLYFLSEIRDTDAFQCYRFFPSKAEIKARDEIKARSSMEQAALPSNPNNDVLIALNQ